MKQASITILISDKLYSKLKVSKSNMKGYFNTIKWWVNQKYSIVLDIYALNSCAHSFITKHRNGINVVINTNLI